MKINGIEQVNTYPIEDPYSEEADKRIAGTIFTVKKGEKIFAFYQDRDETYNEFCRRVDKEIRTL